ncbi:hypothetical protein E2562_016524 [Oryza meyeriana var. granulata]|uniref:DUF1618 domain-containing protein n=1 Tax=Oryza meyeriana var. granulata TaxID=110450 RepID=A0A6G1C6Y5_9ORYZ|nr:hypothetical protein E2562_016524 [Oryza meyeriana var. granulata]
MESTEPSSDAPPAAAYTSWVMLNHHARRGNPIAAETKTAASSRTSNGDRITAFFRLTPPPASTGRTARVRGERTGYRLVFNHFAYVAGGGGASRRPPSLSLLPPCNFTMQYQRKTDRSRRVTMAHAAAHSDDTAILRHGETRKFASKNTGVLRRGEDELAVVQLELGYDTPRSTAELCVLRPGRDYWELMRLSILHDGETVGNELSSWHADAVVPIGDRFLCWVDYLRGFLLCCSTRTPISADGSAAVGFVSVDRRCCGGGSVNRSNCPRSVFAFTITTWTLTIDTMTWTKDGVLDSDELWALPGYEEHRLPRVPAEYPVLSVVDPGVVCLMVSAGHHFSTDGDDNPDWRRWIIMVDTRSKTLQCVVRYNSGNNGDEVDFFDHLGFIPSEVSSYLKQNASIAD